MWREAFGWLQSDDDIPVTEPSARHFREVTPRFREAHRLAMEPAPLVCRTGAPPRPFAPPEAYAEDAPPAPFPSTGPQGHRHRMREKLLFRGPEALADYEVLEMLLFAAFRTGDTKPLAKALINR